MRTLAYNNRCELRNFLLLDPELKHALDSKTVAHVHSVFVYLCQLTVMLLLFVDQQNFLFVLTVYAGLQLLSWPDLKPGLKVTLYIFL